MCNGLYIIIHKKSIPLCFTYPQRIDYGLLTPRPNGNKGRRRVGQLFDPYLHQAVGVASDGVHPPGAIVVEQRRGYTGPGGVLRYAEVIVNRDVGESDIRS